MGLAWYLSNSTINESPIAAMIFLGILGAFVFSFAGSFLPRPPRTALAGDPPVPEQIRIYYLNQALVPLPFIVALTIVAFIEGPRGRADPSEKWIGYAAAALSAVLIIWQGYQTLWATFDRQSVTLFRLFGSKRIEMADVAEAGFLTQSGQLAQGARIVGTPFVLALRDGRRMELAVPSQDAAAVVAIFKDVLSRQQADAAVR